jgi:hypothetical protein
MTTTRGHPAISIKKNVFETMLHPIEFYLPDTRSVLRLPLVAVQQLTVGYYLALDSVAPSAPIEHEPMQISFSLTNATQTPVSGFVSGPAVYDVQVNELQPGDTFTGSLAATAPAAGHDVPVEVDFFRLPLPEGIDFPLPNAEATTTIDVAARFAVDLESFHVDNTRALHNDTDVVSISAQLGDGTPLSANAAMGDVNNGDHKVGLTVGPFDVVPGLLPDLTITFAIVNAGYNEGTLRTVLDDISSATEAALDKAYPAFAGVWFVANELTRFLNRLLTADCDGVVAADKISLSSLALDQVSRTTRVYRESQPRVYPGTDSADGCGSNSEYSVTWS